METRAAHAAGRTRARVLVLPQEPVAFKSAFVCVSLLETGRCHTVRVLHTPMSHPPMIKCPEHLHLQLFSSVALTGISSTQSAGNQPTWPRALPSQNPPSPMFRTGTKGNDEKRGEGER